MSFSSGMQETWSNRTLARRINKVKLGQFLVFIIEEISSYYLTTTRWNAPIRDIEWSDYYEDLGLL